MKKIFCVILAIIFCLPIVACNAQSERYDELAQPFIEALLLRDGDGMGKYLHPDFKDSAMPNDEFYKALEEQYFSVGHPLDGLDSISKSKADIEGLDGTAKRCIYVARVNELFYTVDLIILDNDNGFGIVSVAMLLNTDPKYYNQTDNR